MMCDPTTGWTVALFEGHGEWWLPHAPDNRVSGTLTTASDGASELLVIGELRSMQASGEARDGGRSVVFTAESLARGGTYPRIHGQVGTTSVTLEDCFRLRRGGNLLGGLATERIHVNQVFKGIWFDTDEDPGFLEARIQLAWLGHWVATSGFSEQHEFERTEDDQVGPHRGATISIEPIESTSCSGPGGSSISLEQVYGVDGDRVSERRITQDFAFKVRFPDIASQEALLDQASALQALVAIGTGRSAQFLGVQFKHPDVVREFGDTIAEIPIDWHARWRFVDDDEPKPEELLFSLPDAGGIEFVERWMRVTEPHLLAMRRVMESRHSSAMLVSDRLLNTAAALEALDRDENADDISFVDRMIRCASVAGPLFENLVGDPATWARAFKASRVDVAHHLSGIGAGGTSHLFLAQSGYWLFVFCLLENAEVGADALDRISRHSSWSWLRTRVANVLSASEQTA